MQYCGNHGHNRLYSHPPRPIDDDNQRIGKKAKYKI